MARKPLLQSTNYKYPVYVHAKIYFSVKCFKNENYTACILMNLLIIKLHINLEIAMIFFILENKNYTE